MSKTLETAIVLPISLLLLLVFAGIVFPAYAALKRQVAAEVLSQRQSSAGQSVYRAYHGAENLPQLESHVDAYKDLLSLLEDNLPLLKGGAKASVAHNASQSKAGDAQ